MKNIIISIILLIFIIVFSTGLSAAEENQLNVNLNLAPMQQLTVNKGLSISFTYPWSGMEKGKALILRNVGLVNIKSNVDWSLNFETAEIYRDLAIYIRPTRSGEINAEDKWQRIDLVAGNLIGRSGSSNIGWDIKIVPFANNNDKILKAFKAKIIDRKINLILTLAMLS